MNNAKYAFYYLLSLVALVFVAINSGIIIFQIINKLVPDSLTNYSDSVNQEMLRFAIASLIFASPVFYGMNKLIKRGLVKAEISLTDGIRRWLTYFIIFVASVVILVWLITTMNSFLNGELTVKVILKTLTILVIAGSVFGYYFYDIKKTTVKAKDKLTQMFFLGSLVLLVAIFISAILITDKPSLVRDQRHDQTVINNLQEIDGAINQFYQLNKKLPVDLDELMKTNGLILQTSSLSDPASKTAYGYKIIDAKTYELCANFKLASDDRSKTDFYGSTWRHQTGEQCFKKVINEVDAKAIPVR